MAREKISLFQHTEKSSNLTYNYNVITTKYLLYKVLNFPWIENETAFVFDLYGFMSLFKETELH